MAWMHPLALEHRRKLYTRQDAWRLAPHGTPEAKMPGWLDPSATHVRWKEAQEEEARKEELAAQEEFERELLQLRCEVKKLKLDHELWLLEEKYSPSQPRVPAGSPQGGQWTSTQAGSGSGASADESEGAADEPDSPPFASTTIDDASEIRPILIQMTDERPVYEKADSVLLTPKGVDAASSERKLKYTLEDHSDYLGGVTVINEDRTVLGRLAPSFGRSIVDVQFDAQVQTADGVSNSSFRIQRELTPGSSVTIPWKEFGLLRGPGQVEVTASNVGALYTGVIIGARRVQQGL